MEASRRSRSLPEFIALCKKLAAHDAGNCRQCETFHIRIVEPNGGTENKKSEHDIIIHASRPLGPKERPAFENHLQELQSYIDQQVEWFDKLEQAKRLVYSDDVTMLFNSRFLKLALKQETDRYHRYKQPFSLLFIDLDNFKRINDEFGHLSGSKVLRQLGQFIKSHVRNIDLVFRYGGDEFVVILLGAVACEARKIADRLCEKIAQHEFNVGVGKTRTLTASIGIASLPEHAQDHLSLLKFADKSMYYSKESGKNQVTVFSHEIDCYEQNSQTESTS